MENNLKELYDVIKSDFCNLVNYKLRGNTIEIITGVPTINGHLVSVFLSVNNGFYYISDGGWIDKGYYDNQIFDESKEVLQLVQNQYSDSFGVDTMIHTNGYHYNYKYTNNFELISSSVFELSNYISSIVNSQLLYYSEESEKKVTRRFHSEVNQVLRDTYKSDLSINDSLQDHNEELKSIKFDAIIRRPNRTFLVMYVTGYNTKVFIDDACRATVSFQIAKQKEYLGMTAIVDQFANGYNPIKAREYLSQLEQETNNGFFLYTSSSIVQDIAKNIPPSSTQIMLN